MFEKKQFKTNQINQKKTRTKVFHKNVSQGFEKLSF